MKYLLPLLLLLIVSCNIESSDEKKKNSQKKSVKKNGIAKSNYPDGSLRAEIPMKDGKQHGLAVEYYKNGKKSLEINYVNGIKHGISRRYYEDGTLFKETPYDSGQIHGVEKRYRENGKLAAEVPYRKGNPCMGLKEYLTDGSPRKKYPEIIVKEINNTLLNGKFTLRISMSDGSKSVEYYRGQLLEGNCLSNFMGNIFEGNERGVGEITYTLPSGAFLMEEINIIAKVKTKLGNYYITQRKYNVAAENRY